MNLMVPAQRILILSLLTACGCDRGFYRSEDGTPHGTGSEILKYPSGRSAVVNHFKDGKATSSEWYRPDGALIARTDWTSGNGTGYALSDDGKVAISGPMRGDLFDGWVTVYDGLEQPLELRLYEAGRRTASTKPVE